MLKSMALKKYNQKKLSNYAGFAQHFFYCCNHFFPFGVYNQIRNAPAKSVNHAKHNANIIIVIFLFTFNNLISNESKYHRQNRANNKYCHSSYHTRIQICALQQT